MTETDDKTTTINLPNSDEELLIRLEEKVGKVSFWTSKKGKVFTLDRDQGNNLVNFLSQFIRSKQVTQLNKNSYKRIGLSQLQINIFEEITRHQKGISFEELRKIFDLSIQQMQGQLGAMTLKWRNHSGKNDRMWKIDHGRYVSTLVANTQKEVNNQNLLGEYPTTCQDTSKKPSTIKNNETFCQECGVEIPKERIIAEPATKHCIECAILLPTQKRTIEESWGSREDWRRDRASWKKTNT
ncbi:TraR/DksA C4-type zinc finger protein [Alphaproteobacteria bacterium]|nr:TraR/DksA C4-type zinc finger protein [Alphaproteobacteria bacterium]